jgi:hypothetical protein
LRSTRTASPPVNLGVRLIPSHQGQRNMTLTGQFDREYFFIQSLGDERFPELTSDKTLPIEQQPLIFHNGALEFARKRGITPENHPPDVLFDGEDLIVHERISKILKNTDISNLVMRSAIYIDHENKQHKDYWLLEFTKDFDCWDRKKSRYNQKPKLSNPAIHNVFDFILNEEFLQKVPLHERLLFKMGGATLSPVLAHASIANIFRMDGVKVTSVAEASA